jgi:putative transposase
VLPPVVSVLLGFVVALCQSRASLHLAHLALRPQLVVDQQPIPHPRGRPSDRLFWACLSRLWAGWPQALVCVQPRTILAWPHPRVRNPWWDVSQQGTPGRPAIAHEGRPLIRDRGPAPPTWGAPRMVGERRQLGLDVAQSTGANDRVRAQRPSSPTWQTLVKSHGQDGVALDGVVGPTVPPTGLFVLVRRAHERRRIISVHITAHPTAAWTTQQGIDAFPWDEAPAGSAARSGPTLWHVVSAAGAAQGHRRRAECPPESVAAPLRRTAPREHPPRMPGPRDRPARAASQTAHDRVLPV